MSNELRTSPGELKTSLKPEGVELVLDVREHHLIEKLQKSPIKFTQEQLPIGDILFRKNGETQESKTILVIERKTVNDLKASICDGRAREQKLRLIGSGIPVEKIVYLIEGNLDKHLDDKVCGFASIYPIGKFD